MKLSRDDLKNIVKECLVEILSEGLAQTSTQINETKVAQQHLSRHMTSTASSQQRSGVADKISFLPKNAEQSQSRKPTIDRSAIKTVTADPILQEMLADTALRGTPIIEESKASSTMHETSIAMQGDVAAKQMLRSDPGNIFGEASSKWATLAFAEKKIGA